MRVCYITCCELETIEHSDDDTESEAHGTPNATNQKPIRRRGRPPYKHLLEPKVNPAPDVNISTTTSSSNINGKRPRSEEEAVVIMGPMIGLENAPKDPIGSYGPVGPTSPDKNLVVLAQRSPGPSTVAASNSNTPGKRPLSEEKTEEMPRKLRRFHSAESTDGGVFLTYEEISFVQFFVPETSMVFPK